MNAYIATLGNPYLLEIYLVYAYSEDQALDKMKQKFPTEPFITIEPLKSVGNDIFHIYEIEL